MTKFLVIAISINLLLGCGPADRTVSSLRDTSEPQDQLIGTAREFWIFESADDGLGTNSFPISDSSKFHYFPESLSIQGEDFLWMSSGDSINLRQAQFVRSMDETVIRSVPLFRSVRPNGDIFQVFILADAFARASSNRKWEIDFEPTFFVRSPQQGQVSLQGTFEITTVCFPPNILRDPSLSEVVSRTFDSKFEIKIQQGIQKIAPKIEYRPSHISDFVSRCVSRQGELTSSLSFQLKGSGDSPIDIEFTGIQTSMTVFQND